MEQQAFKRHGNDCLRRLAQLLDWLTDWSTDLASKSDTLALISAMVSGYRLIKTTWSLLMCTKILVVHKHFHNLLSNHGHSVSIRTCTLILNSRARQLKHETTLLWNVATLHKHNARAPFLIFLFPNHYCEELFVIFKLGHECTRKQLIKAGDRNKLLAKFLCRMLKCNQQPHKRKICFTPIENTNLWGNATDRNQPVCKLKGV